MSNKRIDLRRWSIFALIDKDFMSNIKFACVFGNSGNEALMISFDDEVFALGLNGAGSNGVGDVRNRSPEMRSMYYKLVVIFSS